MIKAVATALVLIAGAAVVLWFGNTLNSWILGGLIGGLVALLLSIPISLTLFSYLSHRHDEQLRAEAELSQKYEYEYEEIPARVLRGNYEINEYEYEEAEEEEFWDEGEEYYQQPRQPMRNLPLPAPQRAQEQRPAAERRGTYAPLPRPGTRNVPAVRGKEPASRRATTRNLNYPGMPGYEPGSMLRHHRSAAFRTARMEKLQQSEDDVEVLPPTHISRRLPSTPSERDSTGQYEQVQRSRSSRQLPSETPPQQRRQRVIESKPSRHDLPRSLPPEGGSTLRRQPSYLEDPETENFDDYYPETGPMRRQTGQTTRNPRFEGENPQTESPSGSLGRPLVRRAPYTYDDDPIRQELSQQLRPPRVRRSSRLEPPQYDQE